MIVSVRQAMANQLSGAVQKFGKNEEAFLPIALMCLANASIKPLITLSNPNESWHKKKYAAGRESLNELVALPTCFLFALAFKKAGSALVRPVLNHLSPEAKEARLKLLETTAFSSLGIILANFAIPNIANLIIHPLERAIAPITKLWKKPGVQKIQNTDSFERKKPDKTEQENLDKSVVTPSNQSFSGVKPVPKQSLVNISRMTSFKGWNLPQELYGKRLNPFKTCEI